jgi:hypothetical protein
MSGECKEIIGKCEEVLKMVSFRGELKNGEFPGGVPRGREVNKKKGGGSVGT